ncbi:MAG TPA: TolC family protein, partial [Bacteroidetes bacterium]|nr:TolC family protein [Bacteroidota bacterium]
AASELNKLQYKKTREEVYYNISNLYYNAQVLKHQLMFIEGNLENTSRLLQTIKLLYEQKLAKRSDVEKIQLQKERLLTQKKTVENTLVQVKNLLKFNMGIPLSRPFEIESNIRYRPEINYPHNIIVDLQLANTKKDLLTTELKTLKNSRIPSLSLYGSYSEVGFGYRGAPKDFLNFYPTSLVGLQLSVPVFNGMVTKRKIIQKKLEIKNTELQASLIKEKNTMEITNARKQRNVALTTIKNTQDQIKLAQSVYDQTVMQQKQGLASLTDVLMADNALKEAQQNNITAIINYLKADLKLKQLTGNIESISKK